MTQEELRSRLAGPEDNFTERKPEGVKQAEVRRTMVAFANSVPPGTEAVLFIGVSDDGKPVGVKDPDNLQKKTIRPAAENCYPPINYKAQVLDVDCAAILAVVIGPSDARPHFAGPAYVRKGSESVLASPDLYEEPRIYQEPLDRVRILGDHPMTIEISE